MTAQNTAYEEKVPYSKTIKFIVIFGFVILVFSYVFSVLGDSINSGKKPDEYILLTPPSHPPPHATPPARTS